MTPIRPSLKGVFPRVLLPFAGSVALGNGSQYTTYLARLLDGYLICGIESKGCYPFRGYVHSSYVASKLNLQSSDAKNFADFLNCQLEHEPLPEQGKYEDSFSLELSDEDE